MSTLYSRGKSRILLEPISRRDVKEAEFEFGYRSQEPQRLRGQHVYAVYRAPSLPKYS